MSDASHAWMFDTDELQKLDPQEVYKAMQERVESANRTYLLMLGAHVLARMNDKIIQDWITKNNICTEFAETCTHLAQRIAEVHGEGITVKSLISMLKDTALKYINRKS